MNWEFANIAEDMAIDEMVYEDMKEHNLLIPEVEFTTEGYTTSKGWRYFHEMSEAHMANAIKYFEKYDNDRMKTLVGYITKALEERKCIEAFDKIWR